MSWIIMLSLESLNVTVAVSVALNMHSPGSHVSHISSSLSSLSSPPSLWSPILVIVACPHYARQSSLSSPVLIIVTVLIIVACPHYRHQSSLSSLCSNFVVLKPVLDRQGSNMISLRVVGKNLIALHDQRLSHPRIRPS